MIEHLEGENMLLGREEKKILTSAYDIALKLQLLTQPLVAEIENGPRDIHTPGKPGAEAWVTNDKTLWVKAPTVPPITNHKVPYKTQNEIRKHWTDWVVYAIASSAAEFRVKKALIIIKVFADKTHEWDMDNRSLRGIINGIRRSGVVKDDCWKYAAYLAMPYGVDKGNERTEIAVIEQHELKDKLGEILTG